MASKKLKWYRVLQESFIGDALRQEGEFVQFEGEAGSNLEEVSEEEVRKAGKEIPQEEEGLEERTRALDEREQEIVNREKDLVDRTRELDEREQQLDAREQALVDGEDKPLEKQNVAELRETAKELGVEVPEGATKVEIRDLIKAKQAE